MKLIIQNQTSSPLSYASGAISVAANGTLTLTLAQQLLAISDGAVRNDCGTSKIYISDGYTVYGSNDATNYLDKIAAQWSVLTGATDSSQIGNIGDRLKSASTLYDSNGTEAGTSSNPINTAATLSFAPELLNGRLFTTSIEVNAAAAGSDNALVLFRNPLNSAKNIFIYKVIVGISTANVAATFKIFGQPTLTTTTATITTIVQGALSTVITVTTSGAHGATVGAQATISGTTNFNGTYTVASVTSSTVYTINTTISILGASNSGGTSVVASSLGTLMSIFPLKRVASPVASIALANQLPTLSSNGSQLITIAQGQNTTPPLLVDSAQISLEPGQNLVISGNPNSNNRSTTVTLIWSEVPQ